MEKIKLPRSSFEEIKKIISAYGALNKPVGLDDISHSTGVGKTVVSANNSFLSGIGIIEGGNKKSITAIGLKLSRSIEHDMDKEMQLSWAEIINQNDFLTKMLQAVKIRKGMDSLQLENHIAFSSGELKTNSVMTGARAVVDILLASALLKPDGDKLVANQTRHTDLEEQSIATITEESTSSEFIDEAKSISIIRKHSSGINLNIQLNITATPSELDGLGVKIKALIDELKDDI